MVLTITLSAVAGFSVKTHIWCLSLRKYRLEGSQHLTANILRLALKNCRFLQHLEIRQVNRVYLWLKVAIKKTVKFPMTMVVISGQFWWRTYIYTTPRLTTLPIIVLCCHVLV
ncbi:hypothetical protein BC941DRAFT_476826 [Chlamydoabsidia padenii]|nr:hypothetical protein BC941DRAFT_476826 [Chlamydoabsidia padenii]